MSGYNFLGICTIIAFMATFLSGIVGSYFGFRAILKPAPNGRRRMVRVWRLNALLFADKLSTIGRAYGSRYLSAIKVFLCSVGALIVLLAMLDLAKPN
jgi:hypothetical protein